MAELHEYVVTVGRLYNHTYQDVIRIEVAYTAADAVEQVRVKNQHDASFQGVKAVEPLISYRYLEGR